MSSSEIERFMNGELVHWVESSIPNGNEIVDYSSLLDGTILHSVYLQIDPTPQYQLVEVEGSSRVHRVLHNLNTIVKNLTTLYHSFNQLVLYLPDCSILSESPDSCRGLEQMKLMIKLLLGAAVQCSDHEKFINRIQSLDEEIQISIMKDIREVIEEQSLVLNQAAVDQMSKEPTGKHVVRLVEERDRYWTMWTRLKKSESAMENAEVRRLTATLAANKDQIEKLRQEGDVAAELLRKLKVEFDRKNKQYQELSVKSQDWYGEAQRVSAYRDEADAMRERAERAEYAVKELQVLRKKLDKLDVYRNRVKQLEEDKSALEETKKIDEAQLYRLQQCQVQLSVMEAEIEQYRHEIISMSKEFAAAKNQIRELTEENVALQLDMQSSTTQKLESDEYQPPARHSLSDQLTNHIKSKNIKLELENRRLLAEIESLQRSASKIKSVDQQSEQNLKALTMDNSQLASSRSSLKRQLDLSKQDYEALQRLHAKLSDDHAVLKNSVDDLKAHNRSMKYHGLKQSKEMTSMQEKLVTLTEQHSELKEDFSKLFQESDQIRNTNNTLMRQMVELEVDIKHKLERIATLEIELATANQKCEMLHNMHAMLDSEKRADKEQYDNLMNQYNQLLVHLLEDTKHFHENEKMYMEKINEMQRLKGALEEKILAYYGKGSDCTPTKKTKKNPLSGFTFIKIFKKDTPKKEKPKASIQSDKEETTPDAGSIESDASSEEVFINQLPVERDDSEHEGEYVSLQKQPVRRSLVTDQRFKPVQSVRYSLSK